MNLPIGPFLFLLFLASQLTVLTLQVTTQAPDLRTFALGQAVSGDAISYSLPVERLYLGQGYSPDLRMPGYVFPHLLSLALTDDIAAARILTLFINIVIYSTALSVFCIGFLALTNNRFLGALLAVFLVSHPLTYLYIERTYTETLTFSAVTLSIYCLYLHFQRRGLFYLVFSSLLLTWSYFLRPVSVLNFALFTPFVVLLTRLNPRTKVVVRNVAVFLSIPLLLNGGWIVRNLKQHDSFYPFFASDNGMYPMGDLDPVYEIYDLITAWGGNIVYWEPGAEIRWFGYIREGTEKLDDHFSTPPIPGSAFTNTFTPETAQALRDSVRLLRVMPDGDSKRRLSADIKARARMFTASIRSEHPILFHVGSRLRCLKRFALDTRTGAYNVVVPPPGSKDRDAVLVLKGLSLLVLLTLTIIGPITALFRIFRAAASGSLADGIVTMALLASLGNYFIYPCPR